MIAQQVGKEVFNDQIGSLNANRCEFLKNIYDCNYKARH